MIDERIIIEFHGELKKILDKELEAGNIIVETWHGDWPDKDVSVILLLYPFKTSIQKHFDGIEFNNVNDPHYWKADYYDVANNILLACKFGNGNPDFSEL